MFWSYLFFPGNSEKKTLLAERGQLKALLGDCFTAVNHLIDCIEENFPGQKLEKIDVQKSESLGDNCSIIIERANQIEKLLKEKAFDIEERMDTKLFKKLKNLNTRFEQKFEISNNKKQLIRGISFTVAVVLLVTIVNKGYVSENVISNFGMIKTILLGSITLVVLSVGMDMVLSDIYGAFERKELEEALEEYAKAVEDFEPAPCKFCKNICKVTEMIEMHNKK